MHADAAGPPSGAGRVSHGGRDLNRSQSVDNPGPVTSVLLVGRRAVDLLRVASALCR
ncbi:putative leader peptide [Kineococcus sp. NUM-3379]